MSIFYEYTPEILLKTPVQRKNRLVLMKKTPIMCQYVCWRICGGTKWPTIREIRGIIYIENRDFPTEAEKTDNGSEDENMKRDNNKKYIFGIKME